MSKDDRTAYYNQLGNQAFSRKVSPYTYSGKPKLTVEEWYSQWCKQTKRNGGVLIGTSIKELLNDFRKEQSNIS